MFDFGGVIAEEGFREGLRALGSENGLDPERFFVVARELIYETGYVTGHAPEAAYWEAVRRATGLKGADAAFRRQIISRFVLRASLLDEADRLRAKGFQVGVLSDQTDWLDEIEEAAGFSRHFDPVLNSYRLGKSKREPSLFRDVAILLHRAPEEILFIDDDENNARRAAEQGWKAIHFVDIADFRTELAGALPGN